MILNYPQFRRSSSLPIATKNPRGSLAVYKHKLRTKIVVPDLIIPCVWRGASEIVAKLIFNQATALSFFDNVPTNPNYCAVVSWTQPPLVPFGLSEKVRYKLWENVGEILYVDLYNGQIVGLNPSIEIWNTKDAVSANIAGFELMTTDLVTPACSCDNQDHISTISFDQCTDVIFNTTDYSPINNDHFVIVGTCGATQLIHGIPDIAQYEDLTLQADDGTWHKFDLVNKAGIIEYEVTQDAVGPAAKAYYPLIYNGNTYALELVFNLGVYSITIDGPIVDAAATANVIIHADDGNYYQLYLVDDGMGGINVEIDQTPV